MKAAWDFKVARSEIAIYTERIFKALWDFKLVCVHFGSHVNVLLITEIIALNIFRDCAKFRGPPCIVGLVGLASLCYRGFVRISWLQKFFSYVSREFNFFLWAFCESNFLLLSISCVEKFFRWVFCRSNKFSRRYFVGRNTFLVGISCVQNSFLWVFQYLKFWVVRCMRNSDRKQEYKNTSLTAYSIPNRFQQCQSCIYWKAILPT